MELYAYEPLPEEGFMRVLSVARIHDTRDDVHGTLQIIPIGTTTPYAALSYSWGMDGDGDASIYRHIKIDGKALGVTRNLYEGLLRIFSGEAETTPIWIDAVCIDQSNIGERSSQVAKMAEIYASAWQVFVWLGEGQGDVENDRIATVLECLRSARHQHYHQHAVVTPHGRRAHVCLAHAGLAAATALNNLRTSGTNVPPEAFPSALPHAVTQLFDLQEVLTAVQEVERLLISFAIRRYWGRRWVVQEMFHADHNETFILWGGHGISIRDLQSAMFRVPARFSWREVSETLDLDIEPRNGTDLSGTLNRLKSMLALRGWSGGHGKMSGSFLAWSLQSSNGYECSDPRDRVYALLSMDSETDIRPDYRLNADDVYTAFCTDLINNDTFLSGMLYSAAERCTQGKHDDAVTASLPSWCLDLRDDFRLPQRVPALGPCWVNDRKQLTCSALVIGTLGKDLKSFVARTPTWEACAAETATVSHPVSYVYSHRSRAGDLICIFDDATDKAETAGSSTIAAVILQSAMEGLEHSIVGVCVVSIASSLLQGCTLQTFRMI